MVDVVFRHVIPVTLKLLPREMDSPAARAMLFAIGLQESRFTARRQYGGPAKGFWQFEVSGTRGVMLHPASAPAARALLDMLQYERVANPSEVHAVLEHNDILACGFARLLLWTLPEALPGPEDVAEGWRQYLSAWRPGKPHLQTWAQFYEHAWECFESTQRLV